MTFRLPRFLRSTKDSTYLLQSLFLIYFLVGLLLTSLAPRMPQIKHFLHADNQQLGMSILGYALGKLAAICCQRIFHSIPPIYIIRVGTICFCLSYLAITVIHTPFGLGLIMFATGFIFQPMDVNSNVIGTQYERRTGKLILIRLHGFYSMGTFVGALISSLCAMYDVIFQWEFLIVGILALCLAGYINTIISYSDISSYASYVTTHTTDAVSSQKISLSAKLILFITFGFCTCCIENSSANWGTLFFEEAKNISPNYAGYSLTLFCCSFMISRLLGDRIRGKIGVTKTLSLAAIITTLSLYGVMLLPPYESMALYFTLGSGVAMFFPLLVTISAILFRNAERTAMLIISAVSTLAAIIGPTFIGKVTHRYGMYTGMWSQPLLATVVIVLLPAMIKTIHKYLKKNADADLAGCPTQLSEPVISTDNNSHG